VYTHAARHRLSSVCRVQRDMDENVHAGGASVVCTALASVVKPSRQPGGVVGRCSQEIRKGLRGAVAHGDVVYRRSAVYRRKELGGNNVECPKPVRVLRRTRGRITQRRCA